LAAVPSHWSGVSLISYLYFDDFTAAGMDEILGRRIGKADLAAIAACVAIPDARNQYFRQAQQYAQKFINDEGKQNGLYWPVSAGQPPIPFEDVRAKDCAVNG
jgi:hypothetical protein